MEDVAIQLGIDIERRTTRGRSCPRCGGKIIPSRRAVYQSTGDPNAVFPAWQCERCGYEELVAKPIKVAKHGAKAAENKAATAQKTASGVVSAGSGASPVAVPDKPPAARAVPALKDKKGRALPPDVNRMMAEMNREVSGKQ
jgi:DNA-directed RNA polymerase subunit M/transcription elongation factor TFIIS